MTVPLIGLGLGLEIGDLDPFALAPQIPEGANYAQRDMGADGTIHEQGLHCLLLWPTVLTVTTLQALLAQMGIGASGAQRSAITAYLPDFERSYHLYQGYAIRPRVVRFAYFPSDLRVMLNELTRLD